MNSEYDELYYPRNYCLCLEFEYIVATKETLPATNMDLDMIGNICKRNRTHLGHTTTGSEDVETPFDLPTLIYVT